MSVRSTAAFAVPALMTLAIAATALSGCHDGKGVRTETTKVTVTGTPKAGYVSRQSSVSRTETKPAQPTATGSGSRP
jgi:hypothetical protein